MEKSFDCLRCQARMEMGFVLDRSDATQYSAVWVKGPAEKSMWAGVKDTSGKEKREIVTYRCTGCGYLESYAKAAAN